MTQKHYAQPGAITNAGTARVAELLSSNRIEKSRAEEVLALLDEETVSALRVLLGQKGGADD